MTANSETKNLPIRLAIPRPEQGNNIIAYFTG